MLFYLLGTLSRTNSGTVSLTTFLEAGAVSFVIGFLFGNLALPFTRWPVVTNGGSFVTFDNSQIFWVFLGVFLYYVYGNALSCNRVTSNFG